MRLIALAWRNVLRNRRRTLMTLAAIGVAATAIVLLGGYVSATLKGLQTLTVRATGHLQIMTRGQLDYGRANPARYAIADPQALIERLRADDTLRATTRLITPMLQVQGVAGHFASGQSSTFAASGWRPADRVAMLAWDGLALGMPPAPTALDAAHPDTGVIGAGLARLLDLCVPLGVAHCPTPARPASDGSPIAADLATLSARVREQAVAPATAGVAIELLAASANGAPNVVRMNVARAEPQGVRELDLVHVGLPLDLAQRLVFGAQTAGASSIVVQLHDSRDLPAAQQRIEALLAQWGFDALEVRPFQDIAPAYNQIVAMFGSMFGFVAILMAVVSLFSVANTVNMAVSERTAEIGVLRAIGLRRRQIRRMFVLEGGLMGFVGALLGMTVALALAAGVINPAGLTWMPPGNASPVPISVDVRGSLRLCMITALALTSIACLSSWWPARRASSIDIVEALRHA